MDLSGRKVRAWAPVWDADLSGRAVRAWALVRAGAWDEAEVAGWGPGRLRAEAPAVDRRVVPADRGHRRMYRGMIPPGVRRPKRTEQMIPPATLALAGGVSIVGEIG